MANNEQTAPWPLPDVVRLRVAAAGPDGTRWLATLSDTVRPLSQTWAVQVGGSLSGGSASLVLEAFLPDGTPAIIKLCVPGEFRSGEATALGVAAGRGYVRLLAEDRASEAFLLERLGAPLAARDLSADDTLDVLCAMLGQAWHPLPQEHDLATGADKARWLAEFIARTWRDLNRPCDARVIDRALRWTQVRQEAHSSETSVLVHGDPHALNALLVPGAAADDPRSFKFIDPDGLFAEPAYDLGVLLRENDEALEHGNALQIGRARCERLAALTGQNSEAIWHWGFIERVSTGLHLAELGLDREAELTLRVAQAWVD